MTVYGSLAAANTVFTAARAFLFAYGAICAATVIHKRLLSSVLKVMNHSTLFITFSQDGLKSLLNLMFNVKDVDVTSFDVV